VPTLTRETEMDGALAQVSGLLSSFLSVKAATAAHPELARLARLLAGFVTGGKGLRPQLCVAGWLAAGGSGGSGPLGTGPSDSGPGGTGPGGTGPGDSGPGGTGPGGTGSSDSGLGDAVLHAAASLELFHAFALIQDDVMDGSVTRRGKLAMHCALATVYPAAADPDDSADTSRKAFQFGCNAAVLLGDLALVWSNELLADAPLSGAQRDAAGPVISAMRTEVIFGQYLDLLATGSKDGDVAATLAVARYKTASYTVHRPLQLGAVLAGAGPAVLDACRDVGIPLGEAFQLRDDLLGVFGDPARTGKPRLDDLREGKHTTLMALAMQRADPAQARQLRRMVGDPRLDEAGACTVRGILESTGARAEVERMIATRYRQAQAALRDAPFTMAGSATLARLASSVVERDS